MPVLVAAVVVAILVGTLGTLVLGAPTIRTLRLATLIMIGAALAIVDARTRRLPDLITLPSLAALLALDTTIAWTAAAHIAGPTPLSAAWSALATGVAAAAVLGGACLLLALLGTMGGGDVKLAALIGAALVPECGWWSLLGATVAAYALALPHAVVSLVRRRRGAAGAEHVPFGPYLVAGAAVAWLLHALDLTA